MRMRMRMRMSKDDFIRSQVELHIRVGQDGWGGW